MYIFQTDTKFNSKSGKIVKYEEKNLSSMDSLNLNLKLLEIQMKANENVSGRQDLKTAGDSGNMYIMPQAKCFK